MNRTFLILIAVGVAILDLVTFFVPLSAMMILAIVIFRPRWFKEIVDDLYRDGKPPASGA